jgi:hypothetical protein
MAGTSSPDWLKLFPVAALGVTGGALHLAFNIAAPQPTPWYQYLISGLVASLVVLIFLDPKSNLKLFGAAIVGGYIGQPIVDSFQARVQAAVAEQEKDVAQKAAKTATGVAQSVAEIADRSIKREMVSDVLLGARANAVLPEGAQDKAAKPMASAEQDAARLAELQKQIKTLQREYPPQ